VKRERGVCFECGGRFVNPFGQPTKSVVRQVDGSDVRMHKQCADAFDREVKLTADVVRLLKERMGED